MPEAGTLVVVPCYNEASRFPKDRFLEFFACTKDYRFLFVNDGSKDNTSEILHSLQQHHSDRIDVLDLPQNSGKAEAVRQGFLKGMDSNAQFLAYWDADLATPLESLPLFLDIFRGRPNIEMVFGSRIKLLGRDIQRNELRHYLGRVFATCASLVLRLAVYDTQCGAKMFRKTETLRHIFSQPFKSRWIFDVELIARYLHTVKVEGEINNDSRIYELPLPVWRDIAGTKLKSTDFFRAFVELIQIYKTYRRDGRVVSK